MKKNLFWGFLAVVLLGIGTARADVDGAKAEALSWAERKNLVAAFWRI